MEATFLAQILKKKHKVWLNFGQLKKYQTEVAKLLVHSLTGLTEMS